MTAASRFLQALKQEKPLQILGVPNAYTALMAKGCGYRALYLSGASVSNNCFGLADEGLTTLPDVLTEVKRLTEAVPLPLLVDIDTGWDDPKETVRKMEEAGAAAVHIEDQVPKKLCGHLEGKAIVPTATMCQRITEAVKGKDELIIMARSDALAVEGVEATLKRCLAYRDAGADMLFLEAPTDLTLYSLFKERVGLPILANMTEFGKTPLAKTEQLEGVDMVLFPRALFRRMNFFAKETMAHIRNEGTQEALLPSMENREQLDETLNLKG